MKKKQWEEDRGQSTKQGRKREARWAVWLVEVKQMKNTCNAAVIHKSD